MPTYQYACHTCGHQFEIRQRFSEDPLTECPACSGHIRRIINPVGIIFKGSGFYITDNKAKHSLNGNSNGKHKKQEAEAKPESAAKKPESTKADPKTP